MGLKTLIVSKAGKIFKPVADATAKVMTKFDANKPEIMVGAGVVAVLVGTVWMIVQTRKVDDTMAESKEKMDRIEEMKESNKEDGCPALTEKEFRKMVTKVRSETIWAFIKLYGVPALIFIMGIFSLVGGHWILKKRYILTATSLEGMKKFMEFVKQNVIEDAGEEKWEQYSKGVVEKKQVTLETTDGKGTTVYQEDTITVCKPHNNPWLIPFTEETFKSWKPDTDTNFFFLKACQEHWNWKYQHNKKASYSAYEVLDYIGANWDVFDQDYVTWLRNQLWGHHINGDDRIDLGLHIQENEPARRRLSSVMYLELNTEGTNNDIINRYTNPDTGKIEGAKDYWEAWGKKNKKK